MTKDERDKREVEKIILKDMRIFEFGSGGSSIFLAERAGSVISVEDEESWAQAVIPDAGVQQPDRLPAKREQGVSDQLLKPDPLEDGLRKNRPRLLPQEVRPHPSPVSQAHQD